MPWYPKSDWYPDVPMWMLRRHSNSGFIRSSSLQKVFRCDESIPQDWLDRWGLVQYGNLLMRKNPRDGSVFDIDWFYRGDNGFLGGVKDSALPLMFESKYVVWQKDLEVANELSR